MGEQMQEMLEMLTDEQLKEVQQFVQQLKEKEKAREQE